MWREVFTAIFGRLAEGFEQARCYKHWNLVGEEAEVPSGFFGGDFTGFGTKIEVFLALGIHGFGWI